MRKKMLGVVLGCTLGGLQAQAAEFRCQDDVPVVNYSRHEQRLLDQFWDETLTYLDQYLGALKTPTGHCKDSAEATIQTYDSKTGKQQTRCIMKYRDMQLLAKHVKAVLAEPDKAKACFDPQKDYMAFPLYTPSKTVQALSPVSKWINRPLLTDYFEKIGGDIGAAGLELNKNFLAVTSRTDTGKHFRKDVSANTLENPRGESTHHDGEDSRNHFSSNRSEYPRGGWTPDAREHSGKDFGENTSEHPRGGWNPHSSEQFSKDVSIRGLPTLWSSVGWIPFYAENADAGSERFRGGYLYAEVMGPWGNLRIKDIDGETVGAEIGMTVQLFNTFYPFHYHHPQEIYMTLTKPQCIDQNKYMVIHWDSDEFKHQRVENGWTVEIDGSDGRWQQWFANQDPNKEWLTYFERNAIHAFNALEGCNQTIENSGLVTVWARSTSQDNEQSTRLCRNAERGKPLMPGDKAVCDLHDWVAK